MSRAKDIAEIRKTLARADLATVAFNDSNESKIHL
jgi:hypothetical protein